MELRYQWMSLETSHTVLSIDIVLSCDIVFGTVIEGWCQPMAMLSGGGW